MSVGLNLKYLLSIEVWGKYGFTNVNIDPKKLNPIIIAVQQLRVEPIVGSTLYKKLLTDFPTYSGIYKTLMDDHITLMMISYCDWEYTYHGTYQMTNKGAGTMSDEHIRANDQSQNNDLRDNLIKTAKQRERKLIGFLKDNWNNIPELRESDPATCHEDIRPTKTTNSQYNNFGVI